MKKKWMVFAAVVLFLAACGLGLYLGTPAIPKRSREQTVPVQSVASLTGYAEAEALRSRFLGILSRKEAVLVQLDSGRENGGFLVEAGDLVEEGAALAVYDNSSLLLDRAMKERKAARSEGCFSRAASMAAHNFCWKVSGLSRLLVHSLLSGFWPG